MIATKQISLFLGLALMASVSVAQTSTTTTSATVPTEATTSTVTAPVVAENSVTTNAQDLKATPKFQTNLSSENSLSGADQAKFGSSRAPVSSINAIGLIYNLNKKVSFELRQYVDYVL